MAAVNPEQVSVPRAVTIEDSVQVGSPAAGPRRGVPFTRSLSIREVTVPASRYPVEFRTLSLQIDHSTSRGSKDAGVQKGGFKGSSPLSTHPSRIDARL